MPIHDGRCNATEVIATASAGRNTRARGRRRRRLLALCLCAYTSLTCCLLICSSLPLWNDVPASSSAATHQTAVDDEDDPADIVAGHLVVEGAGISTWVAQPTKGQPRDWYLRHDIDGTPKRSGTPFLDARCTSTQHLVAYGHNLGVAGWGFSSLARTYEQEAFNKLGKATWSRQGCDDIILAPAFARRVDSSFETIQRFSFSANDELRGWLQALKEDADACSTSCDEQINTACSVLTLITCTKNQRTGRERTLVVYTSDQVGYSMPEPSTEAASAEDGSPSDMSAS